MPAPAGSTTWPGGVKAVLNFSGKLTVENRYSFTDAKECNFAWELRKFNGADEGGPQGMLAQAGGEYHGSGGSYFGALPSKWERH